VASMAKGKESRHSGMDGPDGKRHGAAAAAATSAAHQRHGENGGMKYGGAAASAMAAGVAPATRISNISAHQHRRI